MLMAVQEKSETRLQFSGKTSELQTAYLWDWAISGLFGGRGDTNAVAGQRGVAGFRQASAVTTGLQLKLSNFTERKEEKKKDRPKV